MAYKDRSKMIANNNKWIADTYDRINLTVPKGARETIKAHAKAHGESVNGFIFRAIQETINRDTGLAD